MCTPIYDISVGVHRCNVLSLFGICEIRNCKNIAFDKRLSKKNWHYPTPQPAKPLIEAVDHYGVVYCFAKITTIILIVKFLTKKEKAKIQRQSADCLWRFAPQRNRGYCPSDRSDMSDLSDRSDSDLVAAVFNRGKMQYLYL